MPAQWFPEATRNEIGDQAPCEPDMPPKAIAHITADKEATASDPKDLKPFSLLKSFFTGTGKGSAPHILWDPFTGKFAQFFPATSRSRALADAPGGVRPNRTGKVVIQIEALFFPHCRVDGEVFAKLTDTPLKRWDELHAWIRSWGVPDKWPMGRPTSLTVNTAPLSVWQSKPGWYAHANVPENDHKDPGTWPKLKD